MATKQFLRTAQLLAAVAILIGQGAAHGGIFTINDGNQESIGDRGGTKYTNSDPLSYFGQGLPTQQGGWPNTTPGPGLAPGMALDTIFVDPETHSGGYYGISGYTNNGIDLTVTLDVARTIRFTWMGSGNAILLNSFWVTKGSTDILLFKPAVVWTDLNGTSVGQHSTVDVDLPAGVIHFFWKTGAGTPVTVSNGPGNAVAIGAPLPTFFAGIDPYTASGTYQRSGNILYLGLSDSPGPEGAGDHDYQDLGVKLEAIGEPLEGPTPVPEPATFTSFLIGLAACGGWSGVRGLRRRQLALAECK